jgi:hypothetical protein
MNRCRRVAALLLLASAAPATAQSVDTLAIRGHTRFLSDDLLGGRVTGSVGERVAAAYIISQLKRLGLSHLPGTGAFALPVPLRTATLHGSSRAVIHAGTDSSSYTIGRDFIVNNGGLGAFRDFGGRAVFLGVPASAMRLLARTSREGAGSWPGSVAVIAGPLGAAALDIIPALRRAGMAGVVLLVPDAEQYDLFLRSRSDTRYFVAAEVNDPIWQPGLPVLLAGPRMTAALLAAQHSRPDSSGPRLHLHPFAPNTTRSPHLRPAVSSRSRSISAAPSTSAFESAWRRCPPSM